MRRTVLALCLLLSGCMVGPDFEKPFNEVPDVWANDLSVREATPPLWREMKWWEKYNDPLLTSLVGDTLKANYTLQVAFAKLCRARAYPMGADATLAPNVNALGIYNADANSQSTTAISTQEVDRSTPVGAFAARPNRDFQIVLLGFEASWELDLFGRLRRGIEVETAGMEASQEDVNNTLLSLTAEVASTYMDLRGNQQQQQVLQESFRLWEKICSLNTDLLTAGLITEIDLKQAQAFRDRTKADLQPIEASIKMAIHRLSILAGRPPATLYSLLLPPQPIPHLPAHIFSGLPSDLLKRRPDIKQAEHNLAAATAAIGVAEGNLYPIFSLTGNTGYQSNFWYNLISPSSGFYSIGPGFNWQIFNFGRIRAQINANIAEKNEAYAQYKNVLLTAFADVENALVKYKKESIRYVEFTHAYKAAKEVAQANLARFEGGKINFISVLQSALLRQSFEQTLIQSQTALALNSILLYKALGGGWEPSEGGTCKSAPLPGAPIAKKNNSAHNDKDSKAGPK